MASPSRLGIEPNNCWVSDGSLSRSVLASPRFALSRQPRHPGRGGDQPCGDGGVRAGSSLDPSSSGVAAHGPGPVVVFAGEPDRTAAALACCREPVADPAG